MFKSLILRHHECQKAVELPHPQLTDIAQSKVYYLYQTSYPITALSVKLWHSCAWIQTDSRALERADLAQCKLCHNDYQTTIIIGDVGNTKSDTLCL